MTNFRTRDSAPTDDDDVRRKESDISSPEENALRSSSSIDRSSEDNAFVKKMFLALFITAALINLDSGGTPSVLEFLTVDFRLTPAQQGMLGAFPFVGTLFMSPFAGQLLSAYNPKICISASLILNTLFCCLYAFSPVCTNPTGNCAGSYILLASKLFIGISQACILIYIPVWVDEFALPRVRTLWMSLIQAGIPLGVMLGYLLTGFLAEKGKSNPPDCHITVPPELESCCGQSPLGDVDCSRKSFGEISECCDIFSEQLVCPGLVEHEYNLAACCKNFDCPGGCWQCKWKFAVFVQICLLAPMCILCLLTPSRFFITNKITHQGNGADETEAGGLRRADSLSDYLSGVRDASQISIWLQIRILWRAKVFVWTSLGLSALYFVVAGIQFWVTQFIVEVLSISYSDALGAFTLVSATGPVGGVIFGGWLVDTLGGYKGTNGIARTTKVILILGVLAVCVAIPTTLIKNFSVMMALIWLLLFFGGAIVPAAVGICLSAVPPSLRPFSSSVSMCLYNILGHSAGCLLPGLLMDIIASARDCEIVKTTPSQILQPCALDILTIGFNLILLWSLNAWFTMSMSGIHAHKNMLASDEKKKENYKREENKKERAASTGDDCLPPRNNWRRLSKTEYDELFHTKVKVWDMESRELEGEMKRQALYQPMTGLFNHSDAAKGLVVKPTQFIVGKVVDSIKDARQRGESTNRGGGEGDRGSMNNL